MKNGKSKSTDSIKNFIDLLISKQNVEVARESELPLGLMGKILPEFRHYVLTQVRLLTEPAFKQQKEFNKVIIQTAQEYKKELGEYEKELDGFKQRKNGFDYMAFENRFRGPPGDVRKRVESRYLKYFIGKENVLDIGCGRGEFLKMLNEKGVTAKGVEANKDMVFTCRSQGLDVDEGDAIDYLHNQADESLGGVFMAQLVEHLEPAYIVKLLNLCHKKLKNSSVIVIETLNVTSIFSYSNWFFMDPTHINPIHPETMKFLLEYAGFKEIKMELLSPVSDEIKLKKISAEGLTKNEKERFELINENIEKTNNIIYGYQEYAIIGKK